MRSYESKRVVDILSCVSSMRKERAGVVQNKEQYALIYKVLVFITLSANSRKLLFRKKGLIQKSLCWTLGGIYYKIIEYQKWFFTISKSILLL